MGPWQQREVNLALDRQARSPRFPVIPVLLPGADPVLGFLGQNTWVDLRSGSPDSTLLAILSNAIRGQPSGADAQQRILAIINSVCPYRGLLYFREEDAAFFFGRDTATKQLEEAVSQTSLVALVGASGSGKSSVARAGLAPTLRRDKNTAWEIVSFVPGENPLKGLAAALLPLLEPKMTAVDRLEEINKCVGKLADKKITLLDLVSDAITKQPGTDRLLLIVDQWEELYTLTTDGKARDRFIEVTGRGHR